MTPPSTHDVDLPTVIVVFGRGAAGPMQIARAARGLCNVVFALDPQSPHARPFLPLFGSLRCVDLGHGGELRDLADLRPAAIVTYSQDQLRTTAALAAQLGLDGHDTVSLDGLTDKLVQRATLTACELSSVRTSEVVARPGRGLEHVLTQLAVLGYPCVLKPRVGVGSRGVRRLSSPQDAERVARELLAAAPEPFLVEELLVGDPQIAGSDWGDYVSVETWVSAGTSHHIGVTGKLPLLEPFREQGMVLPSTLSDEWEAACQSLAEAAIDGLGIGTGIVHTELKLTASGPKIIEVNARLGGYLAPMYETVFGIDLVRGVLENALGSPPPSLPAARSIGFQYVAMPPLSATEFRDVPGRRLASQLAGIDSLSMLLRPGDPVRPVDGEGAGVLNIYGHALTHADALTLIKRAKTVLDIQWG